MGLVRGAGVATHCNRENLLVMATISLDIPDAKLSTIVLHASNTLGYQTTVNGSPNPETRGQFVKRRMAMQLKAWAVQGAKDAATKTASDAASAEITPINIS